MLPIVCSVDWVLEGEGEVESCLLLRKSRARTGLEIWEEREFCLEGDKSANGLDILANIRGGWQNVRY